VQPRFCTRRAAPRRAQDRMHLDCVFSILGDDVCLMLEEMMGEDSPTRRLVDEYARPEPGKPYALARQGVEFAEYMRDNGYHIIPVVGADQLVRARPSPPRLLRVSAGASSEAGGRLLARAPRPWHAPLDCRTSRMACCAWKFRHATVKCVPKHASLQPSCRARVARRTEPSRG